MKKTMPKATLSDNLCEQIRYDITRRELLPGQKINIKELSAKYGVSETPIKTALSRLTAENIVEIFPRQGMRVKPVNIDNCRETFEMRKVLEVFYAEKMIHVYNVDAQFRARLRANLAEHNEIIKKLSDDFAFESYLEHYRIDDEFHDMLISCSENSLAMHTYKNLNPFQYATYVFGKQSIERLSTGLREHEDLVEAIKQGDADKVRKMIIEHMDRGSDSIISILKWDEFNRKISE